MVEVVVRLPSTGTVFGGLLRTHEGSRMTSVPNWRPSRDRVDLLALVEGLPTIALAQALMAWHAHYGVPAQVLGDPPLALILQVPVERAAPPIEKLLRLDAELSVLGNVMHDEWAEQWIDCTDEAAAKALVQQVRDRLGVQAGIEPPRPADVEAGQLLREAQAALGMT